MFRFWLPLFFLGALLGGAVAGPGTVQAQGHPADLAVSIAVPAAPDSHGVSGPTITLTNRGSDPVYAVEVVIEADNISLDPALIIPVPREIPIPPIGRVVLRDAKLIWSIAWLPGRSVYAYHVLPASTTGIRVVQYVATVSSPRVLEPQNNNRAEVWQVRIDVLKRIPAVPDYAVSVAVDDHFPQPGESVTFTIEGRISTAGATPADDDNTLRNAQVAIPLPAGLTYSSDVAPAGTSYDPSTGIWTIDAGGIWTVNERRIRPPPKIIARTLTLTLTATRDADTVLTEQCVTAELSAKPPEPIGQTADNRAKLCLGAAPHLFQSGRVDTFTTYPCVGDTDAPCDATDDVRVRAVDQTRSPPRILLPGTTVIQVQEKPARTYDGHTHNGNLQSVNDATTVSWQTIIAEIHGGDIEYNRSPEHGVWIAWSRVPFNDQLTSWQNLRLTFTASDGNGGSPPGKVHLRNADNNRAVFMLNGGNSYTHSIGPLNLSSALAAPIFWYAEFEKLGTYIVEYTAIATHATLPGDCDTDNDNTNDAFCATETYTFHVGPIADLEVRSGAPSPDATGSHLTIEALNHGPDTAEGVQVTNLPQNAAVAYISQGNYHPSTGRWDLSTLQTAGYRRAAGRASAATLVLATTESAPAATIASTQDYTVCIGSDGSDLAHATQAVCEADTANGGSWHTAPYYDLDPDNNTAALTAHARGSSPATLTLDETRPGAVTLTWTTQPGAATYGIEFSTDGETWDSLTAGLTTPRYTYTGSLPISSTQHYRVYAVNEAGERSRPLATATSSPKVITRTVIRTGGGGGGSAADASPTGPSRLRATPRGPTRLLLYWSGPRHLYGEAITSYELEVSPDGDHWTTVAPYIEVARPTRSGEQSATKYTHTGLTPATTYHYRVYAHNRRGRSLASAVASATTDDPRVLTGYLENPAPGSFQSGLGMIHGWECDADEVVVQINGTPSPAITGTPRPDTQGVCGDTDNGFEHLLNWNALGDGRHDVVVLVDGTELGRASVQVTTFGTAFLHGAHGTCTVPDFPRPGESVPLVWQEARQQFGPTDGSAPPTGPASARSPLPGYLENPAANSFQSGLGVVSGWVCEAETVTLEMGGQTIAAHYGAERPDTQGVCGDTANGFSRLFNWPKLGAGDHEVIARADGVVFDRATVRVVELDIPADADGMCTVKDFPTPGETVALTWRDRQQQFVVTTGE